MIRYKAIMLQLHYRKDEVHEEFNGLKKFSDEVFAYSILNCDSFFRRILYEN